MPLTGQCRSRRTRRCSATNETGKVEARRQMTTQNPNTSDLEWFHHQAWRQHGLKPVITSILATFPTVTTRKKTTKHNYRATLYESHNLSLIGEVFGHVIALDGSKLSVSIKCFSNLNNKSLPIWIGMFRPFCREVHMYACLR